MILKGIVPWDGQKLLSNLQIGCSGFTEDKGNKCSFHGFGKLHWNVADCTAMSFVRLGKWLIYHEFICWPTELLSLRQKVSEISLADKLEFLWSKNKRKFELLQTRFWRMHRLRLEGGLNSKQESWLGEICFTESKKYIYRIREIHLQNQKNTNASLVEGMLDSRQIRAQGRKVEEPQNWKNMLYRIREIYLQNQRNIFTESGKYIAKTKGTYT